MHKSRLQNSRNNRPSFYNMAVTEINLRKASPTPTEIKEAVMRLLNETHFKERAASLQQEFAAYDAPQHALELIEKLLAEQS